MLEFIITLSKITGATMLMLFVIAGLIFMITTFTQKRIDKEEDEELKRVLENE